MDESQQYELEVGRLVTRFNRIEQQLLKLCQIALGVDVHRASIVFFQQQQFGARLNLVKSLLNAVLTKADLATWADITKDISKVAATRNSAVHGILAQYTTLRVGPEGYESSGPVIGGRKIQAPSGEVVSVTDIVKAIATAELLLQRLVTFSEHLKGGPPAPGIRVRARPRTGKK